MQYSFTVLSIIPVFKRNEKNNYHDFADTWNLRNKAEDHGGREEKMKWDETREGDKP